MDKELKNEILELFSKFLKKQRKGTYFRIIDISMNQHFINIGKIEDIIYTRSSKPNTKYDISLVMTSHRLIDIHQSYNPTFNEFFELKFDEKFEEEQK